MIILKLAALFIAAFIYLYIVINKTEHVITLYFIFEFIYGLVLQPTQVRYRVIAQLGFIALTVIIIKIRKPLRTRNIKNDNKALKINFVEKSLLIVVPALIVFSIIGYYKHYDAFSILVDNYKVLEIYVYYYFLKSLWRDLEKVKSSLKVLAIVICIISIIEVFITERGGTGLFAIMCFMPILFSQNIYMKNKKSIVIFIFSFVIVTLSQTRTYILGFALMCLVMLILYNNKNRLKAFKIMLIATSIIAVMALIITGFTSGGKMQSLFNRFTQLSQGFAAAGGYRTNEISLALSKIHENPLIGKGYGYTEYVYIEEMGYFQWGSFMHNAYLEQIVKIGLIGISLYLILIFNFIKRTLRRIRLSHENSFVNAALIGGLASTIGWLFIYNAAPMSTFGGVFLSLITSNLVYEIYLRGQRIKDSG